jgi:hypothetical protein
LGVSKGPILTYKPNWSEIMKKSAGVAVALAAASLFAVAAPAVAEEAAAAGVHCTGVNECKGHGACKTAENACKGQNACKGKGVVDAASKEECESKGGKVAE